MHLVHGDLEHASGDLHRAGEARGRGQDEGQRSGRQAAVGGDPGDQLVRRRAVGLQDEEAPEGIAVARRRARGTAPPWRRGRGPARKPWRSRRPRPRRGSGSSRHTGWRGRRRPDRWPRPMTRNGQSGNGEPAPISTRPSPPMQISAIRRPASMPPGRLDAAVDDRGPGLGPPHAEAQRRGLAAELRHQRLRQSPDAGPAGRGQGFGLAAHHCAACENVMTCLS